jgi:hypothetical protein
LNLTLTFYLVYVVVIDLCVYQLTGLKEYLSEFAPEENTQKFPPFEDVSWEEDNEMVPLLFRNLFFHLLFILSHPLFFPLLSPLTE